MFSWCQTKLANSHLFPLSEHEIGIPLQRRQQQRPKRHYYQIVEEISIQIPRPLGGHPVQTQFLERRQGPQQDQVGGQHPRGQQQQERRGGGGGRWGRV